MIDMAMPRTSSAPSFTESACCDSILSTPDVQLDPSAHAPLFPVDADDSVVHQQRRLSLDSGLCDQDEVCVEEDVQIDSRHTSVSSSTPSNETVTGISAANVDNEEKLQTVSHDDRQP